MFARPLGRGGPPAGGGVTVTITPALIIGDGLAFTFNWGPITAAASAGTPPYTFTGWTLESKTPPEAGHSIATPANATTSGTLTVPGSGWQGTLQLRASFTDAAGGTGFAIATIDYTNTRTD